MKRVLALALTAVVASASLPGSAAAQAGSSPAPGAPRCEGSSGYAEAFDGRRTFLWRPDWLTTLKARVAAGDPSVRPAYEALIAQADAALGHGPYTVVDKTQTPASGDKHDYMSMGPYWWPDPTQPNGLPYVRRDGRMNPERETNAFDLSDLENMSQDVQALALAHWYTGDQRYAAKAGEMVRAWFLAPGTRMNPNLNHGQAVPGRVSGRAEGVIDAYRFIRIIEAVGLMTPSGALSDEELAALRDWFSDLVHWLATSEIGRAERAARNNHGVYYDAIISHFALFAGMDDAARAVIRKAGPDRLARQIEPDGRLPQELARTRSLHYTAWTLTAAFDLADLGRCVGVDLWNYRTEDGRSLRAAADFLGGYAGREAEWPYPELDKTETAGVYEVMRRAAWGWDDPAFAARAAVLAGAHSDLGLNVRMPPYGS